MLPMNTPMNIPKITIPKKPNYIHVANDINFYGLFRNIEETYKNCFLFESLGAQSRTNRYSVIGFDPDHIIRAKNNSLFFDDKEYSVANPYKELQKIMPQDCIARDYAGGLVGYLSYEAVNYFESSLNVQVHDKFDQFAFGAYLDGLVLDTMTNQLFYFYYKKNRINEIKKLIKKTPKTKKIKITSKGDTANKQEHKIIVEKIKKYITNGYTFQCEAGFKSEYKITGDAIKIYDKLREVNPSPYMYYLKFDNKKVIGASPELLFSLHNKEMETRLVAGTIKRDKDENKDKALARELLNDKKEIAEHKMLVDMHRNDIGRVARFGTVKIRSLMDIIKFSFVQHILSEVTGIIDKKYDMFDGVASLLPGGVLSGAPKVESIKIINELEQEARGPYGGATGYFGFNGDCAFAATLRSLFIAGEDAYTQTSSGIVHDSKPEKEYDEIQRKLEGMKKTLADLK